MIAQVKKRSEELARGVNLRSDGDKIKFDHRWVLITAKKVS